MGGPAAHDSVLVPAGTDVAVEVPNPDRGDINSVVLSTFQFPAPASRDLLLVQLLEFIVSVPAYTRLRSTVAPSLEGAFRPAE